MQGAQTLVGSAHHQTWVIHINKQEHSQWYWPTPEGIKGNHNNAKTIFALSSSVPSQHVQIADANMQNKKEHYCTVCIYSCEHPATHIIDSGTFCSTFCLDVGGVESQRRCARVTVVGQHWRLCAGVLSVTCTRYCMCIRILNSELRDCDVSPYSKTTTWHKLTKYLFTKNINHD